MSLKFTKMHGLGNDFIVIDATQKKQELTCEAIRSMSNRHTGIGFDQLLILEPPEDQDSDFTYRIFNADGKEVEQCGNGARCVGHYISSENLSKKTHLVLSTKSGKIELKIESDGEITVNMGVPQFQPAKIPFNTEKEALHYELPFNESRIVFGAVSLGNPHAVLKVTDVYNAPVESVGQWLQQHSAFPQQVNVGFMEIVSPEYIRLRVYERGVGETLACGSGACAAIAVGRLNYDLAPRVMVELRGGRLKVTWGSPNEAIYLTGPAEKVFTGQIDIKHCHKY